MLSGEILRPAVNADPFDETSWSDEKDRRSFMRVFVIVRIIVVASIGFLVVAGPDRAGEHPRATTFVLVLAFLWALLLVGRETRRHRSPWVPRVFTLVDAVLALTLILLTGGQASLAVSVLIIVVITAATRHSVVGGVGVALAVGAAYSGIGLTDGSPRPTAPADVALLLWWPLYFVITAAITAALMTLAERERSSLLMARFTARAEHAAAEEERDLRQRLLRSYHSQQNGLRVLLHEFQTPVVSLRALGRALADEQNPLSPEERRSTARITNDQIEHLHEMLDALGDVAISWRPAFQRGRIREVDPLSLVESAGHAAGVSPPRLQWKVTGQQRPLRLDAQAMRRVLTNLIENAGRHGSGKPVEVEVEFTPTHLMLRVQDRGPGVPERTLEQLSGMYTSVGDVHGSAGLGLWIVQQIVDASGGTLAFSLREGGGLAATVTLPLTTTEDGVAIQAP